LTSLIPAQDHYLLLAAIAAIVAVGIWIETKPRFAQFGILFILLGAALLAAIGVLPRSAPLYSIGLEFFLPLAIPMLLFKANILQIWRESGRLVLAFTCAVVATALGTAIALTIVSPGPDSFVWAGVITAGFVGGSANTAAVADAMDVATDPYLGVVVAGSYLTGLTYMALLLAAPGVQWLWKFFGASHPVRSDSSPSARTDQRNINALSVSMTLALSAAIVAVGQLALEATGVGAVKYLVITLASVAIASLFPNRMSKLDGHYEIGLILIYIFFAVLGAQVDFSIAFDAQGQSVVLFCSIVLVIHILALVLLGRLFRLSAAEIAIASNACILGPPTAAAMAVSRKWYSLATPGLLCGLLGYAVANLIGIAIASLGGLS
jgi:uncharacterized membrane protein